MSDKPWGWRNVVKQVNRARQEEPVEKRSTRKQFLDRCRALNVEIEDDGIAMVLDAPSGYRFAGTQTHALRISYDAPPGAWPKPVMYRAFLEDMEMGTELCEDKDCEYCSFTEEADK